MKVIQHFSPCAFSADTNNSSMVRLLMIHLSVLVGLHLFHTLANACVNQANKETLLPSMSDCQEHDQQEEDGHGRPCICIQVPEYRQSSQ